MARERWDRVTGAREVYDEDARRWVLAPEAGLMAQAGRQLTDIGGGIQQLFGADDGRIQSEAAERNRLFAGTDMADPVASFVGQALPGLATLPLGPAGYLRSLGLNATLAGGEGALDVGAGGTAAERAGLGAAGGVVGGAAGDLLGRMAGRVMRGVSGLMQDAGGIRGKAQNPAAEAWERLGGKTSGSQRMEPGSDAQRAMLSMEKGVDAGPYRSPQEGLIENKQELARDAALKAMGMEDANYTNLTDEVMGEIDSEFAARYADNLANVSEGGEIPVSDEMADRLLNLDRSQIKQLAKEGDFKGLTGEGEKYLSPQEYLDARAALSEDAAAYGAQGQGSMMNKRWRNVDELDEAVKEQLEPGAQKAFATLREQFRVFNVLQKPNVIKDGEVAIGPLNRALRRDSGFGKTARLNRNPTNPATKELFDVARYGADASLQPFRSSDTAQKIAGMEIVKKATNPLNWPMLGGEAMAAGAVNASSSGSGRAVGGIMAPSGLSPNAMGFGRGALDAALFPFIGTENDIPNQ